MAAHRFNVSSRLALLLGESYRTIEQALKELVDNAWDADSPSVRIEVPVGPEVEPVISISDDGEGMSPEQIDSDYLRIARDRRKDRGPRTKSGRLVKGRKGSVNSPASSWRVTWNWSPAGMGKRASLS